MLTDYAPVIAPVVAILNGVIAVAVAQFKPEDNRTKYVLLAVALVLGFFAAGATIYNQRQIVEKHEGDAAKLAETRRKLGELIGQGNGLLITLVTPQAPDVFNETDQWSARAEQFLDAALGAGYVERFRNGSGLPALSWSNIDTKHTSYAQGVTNRLTRLQQFSAELGK
jgi:hypothetical protein